MYNSKVKRKLEHFGFTLLEVLIAVAIVGILTAIVLANLSDSSEQAKITKAEAELDQIRTGLAMLAVDTGKGPWGCPFGGVADPEVTINDSQSGLVTRPTAQVLNAAWNCEWTSSDVNEWSGPYFDGSLDPWGRSYVIDADYVPYSACATTPAEPTIYAVLSLGADGVYYTCDDIFIEL